MELCVIGEYLIDFTPLGLNERGLPTYQSTPGGAPANVACAAAKLGVTAGVMTKMSTDPFGCFLLDYLKKLGNVDMSAIVRSNDPTGLAFVTLNDEGDRDFVFYRKNCADAMLSINEVNDEALRNCKVFHFGSVSLTQKVSRETTMYAAKKAREYGKIVSFDINNRAFLWENPGDAEKYIDEALELADIVKASDEEAVQFGGGIDKAAAYFQSKGVKLVLISLGADGSLFDNGKDREVVPSYKVKVVDTTGAGDNFMGAFLARLIRSGKKPEELSAAELKDILAYSNAAGAVCASRYGAIPGQAVPEDIEKLQNS